MFNLNGAGYLTSLLRYFARSYMGYETVGFLTSLIAVADTTAGFLAGTIGLVLTIGIALKIGIVSTIGIVLTIGTVLMI